MEAKPLDIAGFPELAELAEEVRSTNEPRLLRSDGEDIAKIIPLGRAGRRKHGTKDDADYEAFLASAGSWADVDVDAFLEANRASRDRITRTAVAL